MDLPIELWMTALAGCGDVEFPVGATHLHLRPSEARDELFPA